MLLSKFILWMGAGTRLANRYFQPATGCGRWVWWKLCCGGVGWLWWWTTDSKQVRREAREWQKCYWLAKWPFDSVYQRRKKKFLPDLFNRYWELTLWAPPPMILDPFSTNSHKSVRLAGITPPGTWCILFAQLSLAQCLSPISQFYSCLSATGKSQLQFLGHWWITLLISNVGANLQALTCLNEENIENWLSSFFVEIFGPHNYLSRRTCEQTKQVRNMQI